MATVEEIEKAAEQLPLADFVKLAGWVDQRRQQLELLSLDTVNNPEVVRNHLAFLRSYSSQDEGLYDDVTSG